MDRAVALDKTKKSIFLDILTGGDKYEERKLIKKSENLMVVLTWSTDLYNQLKLKEEAKKNDTLNCQEKILETIFSIKEDTQSIKKNVEVIPERLVSEYGNITSIIRQFNNNQNILIERIITQLDNADLRSIEQDWENELFRDRINELIENLDKSNLSPIKKDEIKMSIDNTNVSIKHKIKLVIHLVFLIYEAEIEFGEKQKMPRNWIELKALLVKIKRSDLKTKSNSSL